MPNSQTAKPTHRASGVAADLPGSDPKPEPLGFAFGTADARPPRFGWAPGGYLCTCCHCGTRFIGDKRAVLCAPCAYNDAGLKVLRDELVQIVESESACGCSPICHCNDNVSALLAWKEAVIDGARAALKT